jgi:hypothetical protein
MSCTGYAVAAGLFNRRGFMLRRGPDYSTLVGQMYGEDALRGVFTENVN